MIEINVCGLSCPEPALILDNALQKKPDSLKLLYDPSTSIENLKIIAKKRGYEVESNENNIMVFVRK